MIMKYALTDEVFDHEPEDGEYFHAILDKFEPDSYLAPDGEDLQFLMEVIEALYFSIDMEPIIEEHPEFVALLDDDIIEQLIPADKLEQLYADPEVAEANSRVREIENDSESRIHKENMFLLTVWKKFIEGCQPTR
jgi:hypothetical protein